MQVLRPRWQRQPVLRMTCFGAEVVEFNVAQDGGLDAGEREEESGVEVGDGGGDGGFGAGGAAGEMQFGLDSGEGEGDGARVAEGGEGVEPGTAGVAETEELGDLVVGFAGGIVEGAADEGVVPGAGGGAGKVEVGVAAGDDEGQSRGLRVRRIGRAAARPLERGWGCGD